MVLGTVIALIILGSPLFANGTQETPESRIAKAKALIDDKNFDEALAILTTVVREDPNRQDEAQDLIRVVVKARQQFNTDYAALYDLLYQQKDEASALKVIAQLEALDKNPNKNTRESLDTAKRTARLVANNKRKDSILARARAQLGARNYGAAVQIYLEGQDLAKDMFLESGFGDVLNSQVNRQWDDLKSSAGLFTLAEARLKTFADQGVAVLASDSSNDAFDALLLSLRDLAQWRQRAWNDGRLFKSQNDFLVANGRPADFYLGYSYMFIHGPESAKVPEGILGAFDRLWSEILDPWTTQIRTSTEARYSQAKAALEKGDYILAGSQFESLRVHARRGLNVLSLWNRIAGIDETGAIDPTIRLRAAAVLPLQVWLDQRLTLAVQGTAAARSLPRAQVLLAASTNQRSALESARVEVKAQKESYAAFAALSASWTVRSQGLVGLGLVPVDPPTFGSVWQTLWNADRARAALQEAELVDRRGTLDYGNLEDRFQTLQKTLADARTLVEGTVKFPLQASLQLADLKPLHATLATDVTNFVGLYDSEAPDVKTPAVLRWPVRGRDLLARLAGSQTLQGQLLAAAQASYALSQSSRKQGQDLVPQVSTAVNANTEDGFKRADTLLNTITARYSQSLSLQEDPAFRTNSDAEVLALGKLIADARNKWLVTEVQKLIDQGSQAYLAQNFAVAKNVLNKAQTLWATYYPKDPNPEIEYWFTLADFATSVASGRKLTPLDPLFNEVQQLLNSARRSLNLGKEKFQAGDPIAGQELMKEAKETLGKILLPYPFNQEARVLNLEVLQASDPTNFKTVLKQSFDAAVAKTKANPKDALSDLEDLKSIEADYPGLNEAMAQVRLILFPPKKVVNNDILKQVQDLLTQANRLLNGGRATEAQLRSALTLVRQGQVLDPTNRELSRTANAIVANLPPPALDTESLTAISQIQQAIQRNDFAAARLQVDDLVRRKPGIEKTSVMIRLIGRINANS